MIYDPVNTDRLQAIITWRGLRYRFCGRFGDLTGSKRGNERLASCICDGVTPLSMNSRQETLCLGLLSCVLGFFEEIDIICGLGP